MRLHFWFALSLVFITACSPSDNDRDTYVIVHGATGGGWDWRGIDELLTAGVIPCIAFIPPEMDIEKRRADPS